MDLKYSNIDLVSASRDDIKAEIERLTSLMNIKKNEEQAIKIFINSCYGATASAYFVGFNIKVAEAITLQGQELIKFVQSIMNRYFSEFWYRDKELHTKLGLTRVERVINDVSVYGDTDSVYITFQEVVHGCDWTGTAEELIHQIYKLRLKQYLDKNFAKFAEKSGTENIQNLEFETLSYSAIFLKKKKYVMDKAWKTGKGDGIRYQPQSKIDAKGVEIVQSSTPAFARKRLKDLLIILFQERNKLDLKKFVQRLKKEKEEFMLSDIEAISMSSSINDYEKGIANDRDTFIINPNCPIHVRAAGYHNYLVHNSKWKNKYELIKSGDKIRYYYAKSKGPAGQNIFGYLPGNFPTEIAPEVDYDIQFAKCVIEPMNRFLNSMGIPSIPEELFVRTALF
jgi:DNA polymerase elongation subunit (family B)